MLQSEWLRTTQIHHLTVLSVRSLTWFFTEIKSKCQQGYAPLWRLKMEIHFLLQLLEASHIPWFLAAPSTFKATGLASPWSSFHGHMSSSDHSLRSLSSTKDSQILSSQRVQNKVSILRSIVTLSHFCKVPLPHKLGLGHWSAHTSWGPLFLLPHFPSFFDFLSLRVKTLNPINFYKFIHFLYATIYIK